MFYQAILGRVMKTLSPEPDFCAEHEYLSTCQCGSRVWQDDKNFRSSVFPILRDD